MKTQFCNSSIQTQLKVVVYHQLMEIVKSPSLALFGTFMISAMLNGVYLSYFFGNCRLALVFMLWGIVSHFSKWCFKLSLVLPEKVRESFALTALEFFISMNLLNYIGMFIVSSNGGRPLPFTATSTTWPPFLLQQSLLLACLPSASSTPQRKDQQIINLLF